MCNNCFDTEYQKFNSYEEFDKFIKEFDTKIAKTIHFVSQDKYKNDIHQIYKCSSCNEIWWLSDPDNHWRGFFLKEENAKKLIDNDERNGKSLQYGCLLIFVILIFALIKSFI